MMAKGSGSSTTRSGISGGTLILTDGDPQSLAGLNRNVSTEQDGSNALKPIFDKDKIEAGFAIVETLQRETGTFLSNRAKETTQAKADLDKELAKPESERDSQKLAALTQQIKDNTTWEMGGSGRLVLTALTAGAGANVKGGAVDMLQGAAANYLQGLATQQVKEIADKLDSEVARAALQGLVACAGASAQGGSCGAGASGAAASVVLNNLLDGLNGKAVGSLTAEEKEARSNLISSIVAGTTAATGGETAVAAIAAKLETENNALALPFLLPGIPGKPQVTPLPGLPGYDKTERELGLEPRGFAEQLVKLGKGLEGIPLTPAGWAQYLIENLGGAVRVYDPNSYSKNDSAGDAQGRIKDGKLPTTAGSFLSKNNVGLAKNLVKQPQSIWGESADSIAESFKAAGYDVNVRQSVRGSGKSIIVEIKGHPKISQIQVHPGGERHEGAYYKISTTTDGILKVVDPAAYKGSPNEKAHIFKGGK